MVQLKIKPPGDYYFAPLMDHSSHFIAEKAQYPDWKTNAQCRNNLMNGHIIFYAIHRLYKEKWDKNHKNPIGQAFYRDGKPLCDLMRAFLELAEYIFLYADNLGHPHVLLWFREAVGEIWWIYYSLNSCDGTKAGKADFFRQIVSDIEKGENPFSREEDPALYRLGEALSLIQTQDQHSNACRRHLRRKGGKKDPPGLLVVLRFLANRMDKNTDLCVTWVEEDGIKQRKGSGGRVRTIAFKKTSKN